jgi:hypothetical protein
MSCNPHHHHYIECSKQAGYTPACGASIVSSSTLFNACPISSYNILYLYKHLKENREQFPRFVRLTSDGFIIMICILYKRENKKIGKQTKARFFPQYF